jgi:hypothetical protein
MRISFIRFLGYGALGAMLAFVSPAAVAKTAKECDADYAANKGDVPLLDGLVQTCDALFIERGTPSWPAPSSQNKSTK